ncbi:hypothetical protein SAMN05414139_03834 [Burkholderia sp. D7]|nr:hypothetical protein SAMN05414139_03834 [Burkholderia sp. D7]
MAALVRPDHEPRSLVAQAAFDAFEVHLREQQVEPGSPHVLRGIPEIVFDADALFTCTYRKLALRDHIR